MSQRNRRVSERVKEIVAEQLMDMKDPRIGFVTVTDVRVSTDLSHAQVFYTVLPDDEETRTQTAEGLDSAMPVVRRELGRRLRTRNTPALSFTNDPVPEHGRHIENLIASTKAQDRTAWGDDGSAHEPQSTHEQQSAEQQSADGENAVGDGERP